MMKSYHVASNKLQCEHSNKNDPVLVNRITKITEDKSNLKRGLLDHKIGETNEHIISEVGSVRGIKNRVKDRIKLFLEGDIPSNEVVIKEDFVKSDVQIQKSEPSSSKVIIYTTSLGLVRKTKSDCVFVRNAFRNLMIKTEEKDIVIDKYRNEYKQIFQNVLPPQIIIDGKCVGGAIELDNLIESGEIKELTQNIESVNYVAEPCSNCADHAFTNCPKCLGSGRSRITRMGNSRELNYLKCTFCDEGLIRCFDCIDVIN